MILSVYTDGSAKGTDHSHAYGGWAYAVYNEGELLDERTGFIPNTTNQQMELYAAILGLSSAINMAEEGVPITVFSDSAYLVNCYKQGWWRNWLNNGWVNSYKQPVANKEFWELLIPYFKKDYITFEKVKGHAGNRTSHERFNDHVDKMAQASAEEGMKKYENSSN